MGEERGSSSASCFSSVESELLTFLEHLNRMLRSSLIANFLFIMNMAHVRLSRASEVHLKKTLGSFPLFKFESRSRTTCSRFLRSSALPDKAVQLLTQHSTTQHNTTQHNTEHMSKRKKKENCGQSRRGYLQEIHGHPCRSPARVEFLNTPTFRALHGNRIVSTPFETIVKKKEQDTETMKTRRPHAQPHPDLP